VTFPPLNKLRKTSVHSFLFESEVAWQETIIVSFSVPPGAHVIKPITDVNYGIRYSTTVEKFPLKISVIYGENKLNS